MPSYIPDKETNFCHSGKFRARFCMSKKAEFLCENMQIKKIIFDNDVTCPLQHLSQGGDQSYQA